MITTQEQFDVLIIGAGLSGLVAAEELQQESLQVAILEARERHGGRTYTLGQPKAPIDLGATWFGPQHETLTKLVQRLGLKTVEQRRHGKTWHQVLSRIPPAIGEGGAFAPGSMRFQQGGASIADALIKQMREVPIFYKQAVKHINKLDNEIQVITENKQFQAQKVLLALPPQNAMKLIKFTPELPEDLLNDIKQVDTWMGHFAKFMISYESPFWQEKDFSGSAMLRHPIVSEIHDSTPNAGVSGMLIGFLNGHKAAQLSKDERQEAVSQVVTQLFGDEGQSPVDYMDYNWSASPWSCSENEEAVPVHYANNRSMSLTRPLYDDSMMFCGSECAPRFPGYMEGAVICGQQAADWISSMMD